MHVVCSRSFTRQDTTLYVRELAVILSTSWAKAMWESSRAYLVSSSVAYLPYLTHHLYYIKRRLEIHTVFPSIHNNNIALNLWYYTKNEQNAPRHNTVGGNSWRSNSKCLFGGVYYSFGHSLLNKWMGLKTCPYVSIAKLCKYQRNLEVWRIKKPSEGEDSFVSWN